MRKEQRKELEDLSLKAFGNKHYYKKVIDKGLLYRDPETKMAARIHLTEEGLFAYINKTIKAREDFLKATKVLDEQGAVDEFQSKRS